MRRSLKLRSRPATQPSPMPGAASRGKTPTCNVPVAPPIRGAARGRTDAGASESSQGWPDLRRGADHFKRYRELLPNLIVEQQADILANLLEAREYAMDAGSAEEKHAWFGKYKGRINNHLSAAGIDMKQAEQDLAAREKRPLRLHSDYCLSQRRRRIKASRTVHSLLRRISATLRLCETIHVQLRKTDHDLESIRVRRHRISGGCCRHAMCGRPISEDHQ